MKSIAIIHFLSTIFDDSTVQTLSSIIIMIAILIDIYIIYLFLLEDPCHDVICQNGGLCLSGLCGCVNGFIGRRCEMSKYIMLCAS